MGGFHCHGVVVVGKEVVLSADDDAAIDTIYIRENDFRQC